MAGNIGGIGLDIFGVDVQNGSIEALYSHDVSIKDQGQYVKRKLNCVVKNWMAKWDC